MNLGYKSTGQYQDSQPVQLSAEPAYPAPRGPIYKKHHPDLRRYIGKHVKIWVGVISSEESGL